ncbi:MAG: hypothetical protein ACFFD4_26715, partial [Candidatus Odinarchaeota archaeon]
FGEIVDKTLGFDCSDQLYYHDSRVLDSMSIIYLPTDQQKCAIALLSMNKATADDIARELMIKEDPERKKMITRALDELVENKYITKKRVNGTEVYIIR